MAGDRESGEVDPDPDDGDEVEVGRLGEEFPGVRGLRRIRREDWVETVSSTTVPRILGPEPPPFSFHGSIYYQCKMFRNLWRAAKTDRRRWVRWISRLVCLIYLADRL